MGCATGNFSPTPSSRRQCFVVRNTAANSPRTWDTQAQGVVFEYIHCWILDTSIEYDHEYFSGFLKVSIQEVLIALRDERHLLRIAERFSPNKETSVSETTDAEIFYDEVVGKQASDALYHDVFSAERFVDVIENGLVWEP